MKSFNVLIVEDELLIAEMIKEMLEELGYSVAGVAKSYKEAVSKLADIKKIDLVMLDINLEEEKTGIDVGQYINLHFNIPFIYLTSYTDKKTVTQAAYTSPQAYISKPFTGVDLYTTIEIIKARQDLDHHILIQEGHKKIKLGIKDVLYLKSDNNYVEAITSGKKYVIRNTLANFLSELNDSNFLRVHRSYAVNMLNVKAIQGQYIFVEDHKCPISRNYKQQAVKLFEQGRIESLKSIGD